jgi:hypothetical protein
MGNKCSTCFQREKQAKNGEDLAELVHLSNVQIPYYSTSRLLVSLHGRILRACHRGSSSSSLSQRILDPVTYHVVPSDIFLACSYQQTRNRLRFRAVLICVRNLWIRHKQSRIIKVYYGQILWRRSCTQLERRISWGEHAGKQAEDKERENIVNAWSDRFLFAWMGGTVSQQLVTVSKISGRIFENNIGIGYPLKINSWTALYSL